MAAWFVGDNERARELSTEGLAGAPGPHDPDTLFCWAALAVTSVYTGQTDSAIATVPPLTTFLAATNDEVLACWAALALVQVTAFTDPPAVRGHLDRARAIAATVGVPAFEALIMNFDGNLVISGPHPDNPRAAERYQRALAMARAAGAPVLASMIMARQLQVLDSLMPEQVDQACRDAITAGYEIGSGNQLALAIAATACHLDFRGNAKAAAVTVGYLEAHHAGVINHWMPATHRTATGRTLREIAASSDPRWKATGAAMSRTEWVDYTLNALPSH